MQNRVIGYSLVLAAAILATTIIAANMPATFAASMLAPVLMSLTLIAVGAYWLARWRWPAQLSR